MVMLVRGRRQGSRGDFRGGGGPFNRVGPSQAQKLLLADPVNASCSFSNIIFFLGQRPKIQISQLTENRGDGRGHGETTEVYDLRFWGRRGISLKLSLVTEI